jgi:serine/threonine protein kinase/tetratricopeptide (TPR) repeat protein
MSDPNDEARSIFLSLIDRPAEEWPKALTEVCGDRPEVRGILERLLANHLLLRTGTPPPELQTTEPPRGGVVEAERIVGGNYKLLEVLGEGGFGVVHLAEQTAPVRRKVAVKILKAGMDSRHVIARFEAERQALAIMDHPNIARVFDGGTTAGGRPFFVMEYVKGVPITDFCDQHRLTPRERLELFVSVCQAVQHAHQKGIIHRDLKPSNVLVCRHDTTPVVKVIDFGIAKALGQELTDKTLYTGVEQMIGTPLYMSPEQAGMSDLDVDTRSDVYSLGVLLYELLTGTTPFSKERFKKAAYDEIRRIIREEDPPRPSTRVSESTETLPSVAANRGVEPKKLGGLMRGELDWIVMKALEKDRNRRYETANGFARDVQRYLYDEPIEARPASALYRLRKFLVRNKGSVAAAALLFLSLVGGIVGTTMGMFAARDAEAREARRAEGEKSAKLQAAANYEQAKRNLAFAKKGNQILGSVFQSLDPMTIADRKRPLQDVLREHLQHAVREVDGAALGDPLEVADVQTTLGASLNGLGEYFDAIGVLEKAFKTRNGLLGPDHPDALDCASYLANSYLGAGMPDPAVPLCEEALKRRRTRFGPEHPGNVILMVDLGAAYVNAGRFDAALPHCTETVALAKAKLGDKHRTTLAAMNILALAYDHAGKPEQSLPLYAETVRLKTDALGEDHPSTLLSMGNQAIAYRNARKPHMSLALGKKTLELYRARLGPDHPNTLRAAIILATAHLDVGQTDLSLSLGKETLAQLKSKLGPNHPDTIRIMDTLTRAFMNSGKPEAALQFGKETFDLLKAKLGADHPNTLTSMGNLATAHLSVGQPDLAASIYRENLELTKSKQGPDHPNSLTCMANLATAYRYSGKRDLALAVSKETLDLVKSKLGPQHSDTLVCMSNHGLDLLAVGRSTEAEPLLDEARRIAAETLGADHPTTMVMLNNAAVGYWQAKRYDKSIPLFESALAVHQAKAGRGHPDTISFIGNLGVNYMDAGRLKEAVPLLEEACAAAELHPRLRDFLIPLAIAYEKTGDFARGAALQRRTVARARAESSKESPQLAAALAQFGDSLLKSNGAAEAESVLRECLSIREKVQPEAWTTFNTQSLLGGALLKQKKYDEAEPLLRRGFEGMKARERSIPPQAADRIPASLDRLVELYAALDKTAELKRWQAERAKHFPAPAAPNAEKPKALQKP